MNAELDTALQYIAKKKKENSIIIQLIALYLTVRVCPGLAPLIHINIS
jgi:hypothetical protein